VSPGLRPSTLDDDLRPMHRALADLIECRNVTMLSHGVPLDRMIRDLVTEMAIRQLAVFPQARALAGRAH
jgi:hypothetical protein